MSKEIVKQSMLEKHFSIVPKREKDNSFAIDQNFTRFSFQLYDVFGDDTSLVIAIICFVQKNIMQKNLFLEYNFDYDKFAEYFSVSKAYLFKKHPKPLILEEKKTMDLSDRKNNFFTTILGNALYLLYRKPFNELYLFRDYDKKNEISKVEGLDKEIKFFESLAVVVNNPQGSTFKYQINFTLFDRIESQIFKLFNTLSKTVITNPTIRKNKLDTLYLFLCFAKEVAREKGFNLFEVPDNYRSKYTSFDLLAKIMQVDGIAGFKEQKKKMQQKIGLLNSISDDKVTLIFENKDGKGSSKNKASFKWENFTPMTGDEKTEKSKDAFHDFYLLELKKTYNIYHASPSNITHRVSFEEWFKNDGLDKEFKINAYMECYAKFFTFKISRKSKQVIALFGTDEEKRKLSHSEFYGKQLES